MSALAGVRRPVSRPARHWAVTALEWLQARSLRGVRTFAGKVRGDWDWYQLKQRLYWPVPRA